MSSRPLHSVCQADKTLCYNRPWVIPDQFPDPAQLRMMTRLHDASQCLDELDHKFAANGKLTETQHNTMHNAYQQWLQARADIEHDCKTRTQFSPFLLSWHAEPRRSWLAPTADTTRVGFASTKHPIPRLDKKLRETGEPALTLTPYITGLNHQLQTRHSPTMQPHNPAAPRSNPSRTRTQPQSLTAP